LNHPQGGPFHLFGWKNILEQVYNLTTFYLMAIAPPADHGPSPLSQPKVKGTLALALLDTKPKRRRLVSLPYMDVAGVLADDRHWEALLLGKAIHIAHMNQARWIELRQITPLKCDPSNQASLPAAGKFNLETTVRAWQVSSHKASLKRPLPTDAQQLMQSFKSKLRSQIKKALKNGLTHEVGGTNLLPAFYMVFSRNMRDLGSPIHHYRLFEALFDTFGDRARVALVRCGDAPVAAGIVLQYRNRLHNPWASSVKAFRKLGTNMLLYWTMLAHACDRGMNTFDFGRSSPGAGTFHFKRQWEAHPSPLYWYYLTLAGDPVDPMAESLSFEAWKRLPVWFTRLVGPRIRRHISL
jgi:FemAB-related protein (PEP-CTERM system-associated)